MKESCLCKSETLEVVVAVWGEGGRRNLQCGCLMV